MQTSTTKSQTSNSHKQSTAQSPLLVIEREFKVPLEQLFAAFKTSDAIKAWWWPQGLSTDRVEIDFREGGRYFINMKGYDQGGGGMTGHFEEITENKRIVMTDQFADKNGHAISAQEAKMPGKWPEMAYITFDFDSSARKGSRFVLSQEGIPQELQKDCKQGWNESFDKLELYLDTLAGSHLG